ncbi:MAG: sulfatase-like hydrolase/transferase [Bryobacterales bacterium]|nr:sulfatase-like hydrolase/transferase [Bryobacterales bacterium]
MLTRRHFLHSAAVAGTSALAATAAPARHPNIIVILADDFGWGSLNCYGADPRLVRTPNIDRLATEGVRFTDANTPSSVCSPSRYALMTGRYCWRTSAKSGVLGITSPLHIEPDRLNMASLLKSAGYSTAAIGKWHLGYGAGKTDYTKPIHPGPLDIGFDYHYGVPQNHGDATGIYVRNRETVGLRSATVQPSGKTPYGRPFLGFDAPTAWMRTSWTNSPPTPSNGSSGRTPRLPSSSTSLPSPSTSPTPLRKTCAAPAKPAFMGNGSTSSISPSVASSPPSTASVSLTTPSSSSAATTAASCSPKAMVPRPRPTAPASA